MNTVTRYLILAMVVVGGAWGQAHGADLLDSTRWTERAYGISVRPPLGAKLVEQTADDFLVRIIDGQNRYQLGIAVRRSKRVLTMKEVRDAALLQVVDAHATAGLLSETQATYGGHDAKRLIFEIEHADNAVAIMAQALVQIDPSTYIVVDMRGDKKHQAHITEVFDAVLGSLQVADQTKLMQQRAEAINRTEAWRKTLGEKYLGQFKQEAEYFRIMENDRDIGWLRWRIGPGEFNQAKGVRLVVETHVQLPHARVDSQADYFQPLDQTAGEAWSVKTTVRPTTPNAEDRTVAETGAGALGTIDVRISGLGSVSADQHKFPRPSKGYLPQVEAQLLPRLLPRNAAGEYGFYWYNTTERKITFRIDTVTPTLTGFVVTSRLSLNGMELRSTYDNQGRLLEKDLGAGRKMVRSNLKQLKTIWRMR